MKRYIILAFLVAIALFFYSTKITSPETPLPTIDREKVSIFEELIAEDKTQESTTDEVKPRVILETPPTRKLLPNDYHIFQTFNNCGPAAMSMALSYYGIDKTQYELGQLLRPYQNPQGNNDDKSVTLEEIAELSKDYDLVPFRRPNGNIETIKLFITYDIPVITRTWLEINDDIGHFRVIKGYDDINEQIIQDDSLQGQNLKYSYTEFLELWEHFGYEYLVLVPKDKEEIAIQILGEDYDETLAWKKTVQLFERELRENPNDIYARFNLSVALYNIGSYEESVKEFEKVEKQLPFRTLWYQIEPIEAYYELGQYDKVFEITDRILGYHNRAFSELYLLRGRIYLKQDKPELAKEEFEKAIFYNTSMQEAVRALGSVNIL